MSGKWQTGQCEDDQTISKSFQPIHFPGFRSLFSNFCFTASFLQTFSVADKVNLSSFSSFFSLENVPQCFLFLFCKKIVLGRLFLTQFFYVYSANFTCNNKKEKRKLINVGSVPRVNELLHLMLEYSSYMKVQQE